MSKSKKGTGQREQEPRDAVEWLVTNQSSRKRDRAWISRWEEWISNPENRADYAEVVRLYQELHDLPPPLQASRSELLEDMGEEPVSTISPPDSGGSMNHILGIIDGFRQHARSVVTAGWWVPLTVATAWLFLFAGHPQPVTEEVRLYATAPGEQQQYALPDGSRITLGGDSELHVRYGAAFRNIELDRGEAFFRVQRDPKRPFVVRAAGGTTTAVGTAFDIHRYANRVQVWVREGVVIVAPVQKIASGDAALADAVRVIPARLARGEEISYDLQGGLTAPRLADPSLAAAWVDGQLVPLFYYGHPLREVIEDVQPYTRRRIVTDPAAADLQYGGIVKRGAVEDWIWQLPTIYPVDVIDCRKQRNTNTRSGCRASDTIVIQARSARHPNNQRPAVH